jgi:hypothetical protein
MAKKTRIYKEIKSDLPPVWEPEEGAVLEGVFLGSRRLRIGKRHKSFLTHQIQNEETGEVQSFSGSIADRMMMRIPQDTAVRVTYLGTVDTSNGPAKNFRIEAEASARIESDVYEQDAAGDADIDPDDDVEEVVPARVAKARAQGKARRAVDA